MLSRWALVSLAALLHWVGAHALRPFVVLRLDELGASPQQIGLITAAYAILAMLLAIPGGRAIDRLGSSKVLYSMLVAMVLVGIGYAFADTMLLLFVLQMVSGAAELGAWLVIQTLATYAGRGDGLAKQLSLFSFTWSLGIAAGPTIGGIAYERIGFTGLALLYSGLAVAVLLVMLYAPKVAAMSTGGGGLRREALQTVVQPTIRAVLLSSFVTMFVISTKNTFYPLALAERGVSASLIGALLSVMGVASLGVRLVLPMLARRFGPGTVLSLGTIVGVVGISATPWLFGPVLLVLGAVLTGVGFGSNPPLVMQLLGEYTSASKRGLAMGLRAAASRFAQVAQPLVYGSLVAGIGTAATFPVSGAALLGVVLWIRRDVLALRHR